MSAPAPQAAAGGPRYAIIPALAATDGRFQGRDLQILCLIGRHTDRNGWCRLNQGKLADAISVSRTTVSRSIARLVEWGYLDVRVHWRADGGRAASGYRVRMDVEDALSAPEIDIEDDVDDDVCGGAEGAVSDVETGCVDAAHNTGQPLDVVGTPVSKMHTPLCTQSAHPPVHSGCTPLTTLRSNDLKKAQRQKKAGTPQDPEAPHVPTSDHPGVGADRETHDEAAGPVADGGDGLPDGVSGADAGDDHDDHGPDRSAAARKAAETRTLNGLLRDFPGAETERRARIDAAWAALSAEDKRLAGHRLPVYLRRVSEGKRKPGRLSRYLEDAPWRVLPDPVEVSPRRGAEGEKRSLPEDVAWRFLAADGARDVLARALDDGVVIHLLGEVQRRHAVPSMAEFSRLRDEWMASRAAFDRAVAGASAEGVQASMSPMLLKTLPARVERFAKAEAMAREVLGLAPVAGGAPPGGDGGAGG